MRRARVLVLALAAGLLTSKGAAAADMPQPERVSFTTKDGVRIVGDFYDASQPEASKPPFVILLHMYQKDRTSWAPLIEELVKDNISVLAIDLRGHGESTELVGTTGDASDEDEEEGAEEGKEEKDEEEDEEEDETAKAARATSATDLVERVQRRDKKVFKAMDEDVWSAYVWLAKSGKVDLARFGLVGASVGCTVAMSYAARDKSVDALVCLSPGTKYMGIRSSSHVKKLSDRAVILISSPEERKECEDLKKYDEKAELGVKLGIDGQRDLHGTDMLGKVEGIESEIADYLKRNLGQPSKEEDMVVASIRQKIYHQPDSPHAARIKDRNRRWFSDASEAEARGLRAAGGQRSIAGDMGSGGLE